MSDDLYTRVIQRVIAEEIDEDRLVESMGEIARGERVEKTYKRTAVRDENGTVVGHEMVLDRKKVATNPADRVRGLMFLSKMPGMKHLGLTRKGHRGLDPSEGIAEFAPQYDESIVWMTDEGDKVEVKEEPEEEPEKEQEEEE